MSLSNLMNYEPEENIYMMDHIGSNTEIDKNIVYTKEQKKIIDKRNKELYQRSQHDETFDIPIQGYNAIQNRHPLGINMVSSHADRGFDYRDYPKELAKDRENFDPYIDYLHKNGLIGKNKVKYVTSYLNIDSSARRLESSSSLVKNVALSNNPLVFNGSELRILMSDTSGFSINDKITINGIEKRNTILRTQVTDDFANKVYYFLFEEDKYYMTVKSDTNMSINSGLTEEIKNNYADIKVLLSGFVGDKKTEWYFDTTNYIWTITQTGPDEYSLKIVEDVYAVTSASSANPEPNQIKETMLIAEFTVDQYGIVNSINSNVPYPNSDLRWTEPTIYIGQGTPPISISASYITLATNKLISLNITPPHPPCSIYDTLLYFQRVQNAIRPIFLQQMTLPANINFSLRYTEANSEYVDTVRIIVPEQTKVTTTTNIGNIPINLLNSYHRIYFTSEDIEKELGLIVTTNNLASPNKFYVKLNKAFNKKKFEYADILGTGSLTIVVYEESISDVNIEYEHYGGVLISDLSAGFPIGFDSSSGYKVIKNIVQNKYISVSLDKTGLYNTYFGGSDIIIGLIASVNTRNTQPNKYTVNLEKVYTDIVMIKMINSTIPKTQRVFMDGLTGGNRNNRLYWENIDDGAITYQIEITPGTYTTEELVVELESKIRKVMRVNGKKNYISVSIDQKSGIVSFTGYNEFIPLSSQRPVFKKQITFEDINTISTDPEDLYYYYPTGQYYKNFPNSSPDGSNIRIKIYLPNHDSKIGDTLVIKDSLNYEYIPSSYLNGEHVITNAITDYVDIVIYNVNLDTTLLFTNKGGNNIKLYTKTQFRLRFDYQDTMGRELGFRDVGKNTSITPYLTQITNDVYYENESVISYINDSNINNAPIDDILTTNIAVRNSLYLDGPSYLLILCKELSNGKSIGQNKDFFYKINLDGQYGKMLYDTFIDSPIFYTEPIGELSVMTFEFITPEGYLYDFNGVDHSFVLEIVTFEEIPEATGLA